MPVKASNTTLFRKHAGKAGFSSCGFAPAGQLVEEARNLERWLEAGMNGKMSWMANHFDKRTDPRLLEPGTRSIVVLFQNYYPGEISSGNGPRISKYALGEDYHEVMKRKMRTMVEELREEIGDFRARIFVDSAPVMEKAWAKQAGIAWQGKHGLSIVPKAGSFFFIGIILTDLELEYGNPVEKNYCGSCRLCIDACPTSAIVHPGVVDARRCISYLTIELKEEIPASFQKKLDGWLFGCDTCQDVCPYNRFSVMHSESAFQPVQGVLEMGAEDWAHLEMEAFEKLFRKSPVKRAGYQMLMKNIRMVATR